MLDLLESVSRLNRCCAWALLGLLAAGCGSTRPRASAGQLVSKEALPDRYRAAWDRYLSDAAGWEAARDEVRRDPELERFVVDNLVIAMVHAYDRSALARAGQRTSPFERAQAELVAFQDAATPVLAQLLSVKDGVVAFLAADTLKRIGAPALDPVAQLFAEKTSEVRRRAVELIGELPHAGEAEPALMEKLGKLVEQDPEWIVRAQAAAALGARGARHTHKGYALGVLSRAMADADPAVAEKALEGLGLLGEPRAIPILVRGLAQAADRGHLSGVRAAQAALKELSGEKRERTPVEWERWYAEHPPAPHIVPVPRTPLVKSPVKSSVR